MTRLFVLALALAATLSARTPPTGGFDATAAVVEYGEKESIARGDARIVVDGNVLTADEIHYDNKDLLTAIGHVVLTLRPPAAPDAKLGPVRLLADKLVYRQQAGTFAAERVRLGAYPYYAEGESASGSAAEVVLTHATVTYGEPGPWQPTLKADTIIYAPGQRLRTENSHAGIGEVQPLLFPKFQQDLKQSLVSNVSLNGGYRSSLGAFVETGLHLPVAPGFLLGGDVGIYTARGVMIGPSGSYSDTDGPGGADFAGSFHTGFINDHGDKKTDLLGRPVPENRAFVEWQHEGHLTDNLTLTADLNWWKDSEVLRDFRPKDFFPVQEPDTFVESTYAGANYLVTAFARFQPNAFDTVQERLPELRFDLLPLAVGGGFDERFNASAAMLRENPPLGAPRLQSDRLDAYYSLTRPFAPTDWLAWTPIAGARVTHYANTVGAATAGDYTRVLGELGFDAALRASATFDYQNPQWGIDGLRHLVTPRIGYRYIPESHSGSGSIPVIDGDAFTTYLPPLGLGDARNIDSLRASNTLRVGLDNTFQTRDATYGSRDLFTINLADDFNFKRAPGESDVSNLHADLALAPVRWLQVDAYNTVTARTLTLQELNSGITLHDGDARSLRFSNNFLRHQIQDFLIDGRIRLNETYAALTRLQYDARTRRLNEQAYGLVQNLDNVWRISYVVSLYAGPRRESHFGLNVQIEAIGF